MARRRGSGREWAYECALAREVLQRACARWRARRRARADRGTNRAGPHRTIERARRGALRTADALWPRLSPHPARGAVWPESSHVRPYGCRRFARICRPCRESRIRLHDEPDGVDAAHRSARRRAIGCDLRVDVNHLRISLSNDPPRRQRRDSLRQINKVESALTLTLSLDWTERGI